MSKLVTKCVVTTTVATLILLVCMFAFTKWAIDVVQIAAAPVLGISLSILLLLATTLHLVDNYCKSEITKLTQQICSIICRILCCIYVILIFVLIG